MGSTDRKLITDEEIALNPNMYRDEDGVHLILDRGVVLIEPSESWISRQKALEAIEAPPEPLTREEIITQDVEVIAEMVAINTDDSLQIAETLALALIEIDGLKSEMQKLKGGA